MKLSVVTGFVPPVALMGLIFYLSAQPDLSSGLGVWDLILRKLAHAFLFGSLTLLWLRALAPSTARALPWAVLIALLFAVSDEYHQTFVHGRNGHAMDVGVDAIGIGIAAFLARSGCLGRFFPPEA